VEGLLDLVEGLLGFVDGFCCVWVMATCLLVVVWEKVLLRVSQRISSDYSCASRAKPGGAGAFIHLQHGPRT